MSDQNKKGQEQAAKKTPEENEAWLFLEASLNIGIYDVKSSETQSGKNKAIEGAKNKVILSKINQTSYKYYIGNFSLDKLEKNKEKNIQPVGQEKNEAIQKDQNIDHYTVYTGYVNWKNTWDIDIKDNIDSSPNEDINPMINKNKVLKCSINSDKIGTLREVNFDVIVKKKCCECHKELSPFNELVYCQNDRNFFCLACDKARHEQKEKMSLNLHLRTKKFQYRLAYFGNCNQPGHLNKPYQYFDKKNKECLCVKCVEFLNNPEKIEQIAFIEEYLREKDNDEDLLNSRIDSICEEINHRLAYAEDVWKRIDEYEKDYNQVLEDDKNDNLKKMQEEGYARQTFLCCIFMEIQRIIKEIDSKIIFIKIKEIMLMLVHFCI